MKNLKNALLFLFLPLFFLACGSTQQEEEEAIATGEMGRKVTILYPDWKESVALASLAKMVMEEKGYEVVLSKMDIGAIYANLAKGEGDLFLSAWLPNMHKDYMRRFGDKTEPIGVSFEEARTGLVVPAYMAMNTIKDLNHYTQHFDSTIVGIEEVSGVYKHTQKAIEHYKLDFTQKSGNEKTMLKKLKQAFNHREPVVVTGWKPHVKWTQYDLKFLEDPGNVFPSDQCVIIARKGFSEEYPILVEFLQNFTLKEAELHNLMAALEDNMENEAGVQQWYAAHQIMIESWWPSAQLMDKAAADQ